MRSKIRRRFVGIILLILFIPFTSCQILEAVLDEDKPGFKSVDPVFETSVETRQSTTTDTPPPTLSTAIPSKITPSASTTESIKENVHVGIPTSTLATNELPKGCLLPEGHTPIYDLPNPTILNWEEIPVAHGQLRQLDNLSAPVWKVAPSYDSQWILVEFVHQDYGMGDGETGLYVLEIDGNRHWLASESGDTSLYRYRWLTDGRLLWVDRGRLFIADGDGGGRRDLTGPEEVYEIWIAENDIALVNGKSGIWRLNYTSGIWDRIEGAPCPGNLNVSLDGSYAMAVTLDREKLQYWHLPFSNTEAARLLVEGQFYGGHGGRVRPPLPIPNSSLWFTGEGIYFEDKGFGDVGIIDVYHETIVPWHELLDVPEVSIKNYETSPDKRWMSLGGEYITSGDVLNEGLFVNDLILGWDHDSTGIYVLVVHPQGASRDEITSMSIEHVEIPNGQRTVLIEGLDPSLWPDIFGEYLIYSLSFDYAASVLYALLLNGEILASIELRDIGFPPSVVAVGKTGLIISLPVKTHDSGNELLCLSQHLWFWDLHSESDQSIGN